MNNLTRVGCLIVLTTRTGIAQSPSFEVASVKLSANQQRTRGYTGIPAITGGTVLQMSHVTVLGMLVRAFDLRPSQIVGPPWLDERYYDVAAKVAVGTPKEQIPKMLQALLVERFRMKWHFDTKLMPGYLLVTDKRPFKPKPSGSTASTGELVPNQIIKRFKNGSTHIEYTAFSLLAFAKSLSIILGQPVSDATGLSGAFDFALDYSTNSLLGQKSDGPVGDGEEAGQSVLDGVRQLGLNLVRQKEPARLLIIDTADKNPVEN